MAGIKVFEKKSQRVQAGTSPEKVVAVIGVTEKGPKDSPISVYSYLDAQDKLGGEIKNNDTMAVIKSIFDEFEALGLESQEIIVVNPAYTKGIAALTDKKAIAAIVLPSELSSEAGQGLLTASQDAQKADFRIDSIGIVGEVIRVFANGIEIANHTTIGDDSPMDVANALRAQIIALPEFDGTSLTVVDVGSGEGLVTMNPISGTIYNGILNVTTTGVSEIVNGPVAGKTMISPAALGEVYTTTKAKMLNLSSNNNFIDPTTPHVAGSKGVNISYSAIQVMIEDTVIGVCDENYNLVPVYDYVDPSGDTYRVAGGSVLTPVEIDALYVDQVVAEVLLNRAYTGTELKLVYTLNNSDDFKMKQNVSETPDTPGTSLVLPVPVVLPVTAFDGNSLLLTIGGTNYLYNGKVPAFDAGATSALLKESGGISTETITITHDVNGLTFTHATLNIQSAHIDIDYSTQSEYLEDPSIYMNQSVNNLLKISARNEGAYYNRLSLFLDRKESGEDDNGNTNTVDSHLVQRVKGAAGFDGSVTSGDPVSNLDFGESNRNIVDVLADDEMGYADIEMDDSGDRDTMPLALQNITSVSGEDRFYRKETNINTINQQYSIGVDGYEVIPATTYIEVYDASGTIVVDAYRDNGVGGFYNVKDSAKSDITLNSDGMITIPSGTISGLTATIRIHFALRRPDQSVFGSLLGGEGGTDQQVLRSDILFGDDMRLSERGIYALLKDSRMINCVIPDLAYSYEVYQAASAFMAEQPVARFSYTWSLSDEIKPSEVQRYTRYSYKYRDKNSFVCFPSFVTKTSAGLKRTIPYVGVIAAKITYRMIKNEPHVSIAGIGTGNVTHGVGPSQKISITQAEEFDDLVIPVLSTDDTGHAVWGDSSLGEAEEGFQSIQDTLSFNMTQFEGQKLLWSSIFKEAGLTTLSSVRRKIGSFLLNNYKDGWYGEADSPSDAYDYDDSSNTLESIRATRTIDLSIEITGPISLKWVNMSIGRKF